MPKSTLRKKMMASRARSKVKKTVNAITGHKKGFGETMIDWSERPEVRMAAMGIGVALAARLAVGLSSKYPAISRFLKENLDVIEDKLQEYRGAHTSSHVGSSEARH